MNFFKIYLAYFIIKNMLKIILIWYLKKCGITIKQIALIIKNKGREYYDKMFHSEKYR